jgi:hypothetical protein
VACDGDTSDDVTPSDAKKIRDALTTLSASPDPSHILNLSGGCTFTTGGVTIQNFPNITVFGPATLTAAVVACGTSGPAPIMMSITGTRNITMRDITITGGAGVLMIDSGGNFSGVTIENSVTSGLNVQGASSLGLTGALGATPKPNYIKDNCGNGIVVGQGSTVSFGSLGSISGNGSAGVNVVGGSFSAGGCCVDTAPGAIFIENNLAGIIVSPLGGSATLSGGSTCAGLPGAATIRNNTDWGIFAQGPSFVGLSGGVVVENNQTGPVSVTAQTYRAGIFGSYGATVFVNPGATIKTTNSGPGILVDAQSKLRLGSLPITVPPGSPCTLAVFGNPVITQNGAEGIKATHMSFMEMLSPTTVTSNGAKDAVCDASSMLDGNTTGVGTNKCK